MVFEVENSLCSEDGGGFGWGSGINKEDDI